MPFGSIMSIISFLKELVFGKKRYTNDTIPNKIRKTIVFAIIVISLTVNYFTVPKLFTITNAYVRLKEVNKILEQRLQESEKCEHTLESVKRWLTVCEARNP